MNDLVNERYVGEMIPDFIRSRYNNNGNYSNYSELLTSIEHDEITMEDFDTQLGELDANICSEILRPNEAELHGLQSGFGVVENGINIPQSKYEKLGWAGEIHVENINGTPALFFKDYGPSHGACSFPYWMIVRLNDGNELTFSMGHCAETFSEIDQIFRSFKLIDSN